MRRRFYAAIAFVSLALLAGCAGGAVDSVMQAAEEFAPAKGEAGKSSLAQQIADKLFAQVTTRADRGVRFCMITAGISELMTFRVTKFDPDFATEALGQMRVLRGLKARYAAGDEIWFETDLRLALLDLGSILVEVGKDRVPRLLSALAGGGVNVRGVIERARVAGGQAMLTEAVIADVRNLMAALKAEEISAETALASCDRRLRANEDRIAAVAGAVTAASGN